MDFFSFLQLFQTGFFLGIFEQAVGPRLFYFTFSVLGIGGLQIVTIYYRLGNPKAVLVAYK